MMIGGVTMFLVVKEKEPEETIGLHNVNFEVHHVVSSCGKVLIKDCDGGKFWWVNIKMGKMDMYFNSLQRAIDCMLDIGEKVYVTNSYSEFLDFLVKLDDL